MKKFTLLMSALLLTVVSFAGTVTMTFNTEAGLAALGIATPVTDAGDGAFKTDLPAGSSYVQDGVTFTVTKHGSTATRIWKKSSGALDLRHYKGGVLTLTAPEGQIITKVELKGYAVTGFENLVEGVWNGSATTVDLTAASDAKTQQINTIAVTLETATADFVATPVLAGESSFMESVEVSITATTGHEIYYTLDGTAPTTASTKYTAPFTLTETTTVKAIAYDPAKSKASEVVEKTYNKIKVLTCAEAVALCTSTASNVKYVIRGYVTEIVAAYDTQYKNITFWMADSKDGGKVLQAYRVKPVSTAEQTLKPGDYVEVIGNLILYGTTTEVNSGGSVELIEAAVTAVDNVEVKNNATKTIENNQLVIFKNGVKYNVQGQVVK